MIGVTLHAGDCRAILPTLAAASVQCAITSPPYWGLRDYGVEGQLGLEATVDEYVGSLVGVFREVRRVLRPGRTFLGSDSTDGVRFRLYHLGDTCVPIEPAGFPERLRAAGFVDPRTGDAQRSFRFRAIRP